MNIREILSVPCLLSDIQKISLAYSSASLPPGATIAETGTFKGGSATILSCNADVTVHTIDLFENAGAKHLDDLPHVTRHTEGVQAFVRDNQDCSIDMYFIDGDHSFYGAQVDFEHMAPLLAKDAAVLFHDYGISYPGVRILCDALAHCGAVEDCVDVSGMLACRFISSDFQPTKEDYLHGVGEFLKAYEQSMENKQTPQASKSAVEAVDGINNDWRIIGKGGFGKFLANFFSVDLGSLMDSQQADENGKYVICSHFFSEIKSVLVNEKGVKEENIVSGKDVLSLGMYKDLKDNAGSKLAEVTSHPKEHLLVEFFAALPQKTLEYMCGDHTLLRLFLRTGNI